MTSTEQLNAIRDTVQSDLNAVNQLILKELFSEVPLIQTITRHIISSGGKRLRPLLVLLCARAAGYRAGTEHQELATIIEFVHTATLLHDDVIDRSLLRRQQPTANALFGNQASILVGDFLYSRAFQMLTRRANVPIMKILANTTNDIAEGEVLQLVSQHNQEENITLNENTYMNIIYRKTAKLFESSAQIGGMIGPISIQHSQDTEHNNMSQSLAHYGKALGLAFQIVDDVLDYAANESELGKHLGDDLAEGKITLPLIYALDHAPNIETKGLIRQQIQLARQAKQTTPASNHGEDNGIDQGQFLKIKLALEQCGAINYCYQQANIQAKNAKQALDALSPSPYRDALYELASYSVSRTY